MVRASLILCCIWRYKNLTWSGTATFFSLRLRLHYKAARAGGVLQKMTNNIKGRFYFQLTINGNLLGEYSNDVSTDIDVEAAKRIPEPKDSQKKDKEFIGKFMSVWTEGATGKNANLMVSQKVGSRGIYEVVWSQNSKDIFKGEGMLSGDKLVGNYWSV